jgi:catechol 2,3-dioxygenase-like lactoylglutathione lyase family enzyme
VATPPATSSVTFGRAAPGVFVRDVARARAFYCGVLGFETAFENGDPVGFVILRKDAAELHLSLVKDHRPSTANVAHLLVDDVDALHAICAAAGVRIVKRLADKDYGLRAFVFADPDGNRIDVGQPIAARRGAAVPERFEGRRLGGAIFRDCALTGAVFDDIDLSGAAFSNVSLRNARLSDINLSGATIEDANIEGLTIFGCDVQALIRAELARRRSG